MGTSVKEANEKHSQNTLEMNRGKMAKQWARDQSVSHTVIYHWFGTFEHWTIYTVHTHTLTCATVCVCRIAAKPNVRKPNWLGVTWLRPINTIVDC